MSHGDGGVFAIFRSLLWRLALPIRWYVRYSPLARGKGLLIDKVLIGLLPSAGSFESAVPFGGRIRLQYGETLGRGALFLGGLERAEVGFVARSLCEGDWAVDVGANVGLFTIAMGRAVGPSGHILAVEPVSETVRRLRENLALNGLENVTVLEAALGATNGQTTLHLADDPAFPSTAAVAGGHTVVGARSVRLVTLDHYWAHAGSPPVRLVKVDVEGSELEVLKGAINLLSTCKPMLLLEANGVDSLAQLESWLVPLGYHREPQPAFAPYNHLFLGKPDGETAGC